MWKHSWIIENDLTDIQIKFMEGPIPLRLKLAVQKTDMKYDLCKILISV